MKSRQKNKPSGVSRIPCSVGDVAPGRVRHKAAQVVIKRNPCRLRAGCVKTVGTLRERSGEVVEMAGRKRLDFCCLQETRWKGNGTYCFRVLVEEGSRYKLFWVGCEEGVAGVGVAGGCWQRGG